MSGETPDNPPGDSSKVNWIHRVRRGGYLGCLVPIVLVVTVGWIAFLFINHPRLNASHAVRIDVTLRTEDEPYTNHLGAITNVVELRRLLSVMAKSSSGGDHKCGEAGWLLVQYENGTSRRIAFLPGHNSENYEYRSGVGVRRMDRGSFLSALQNAGIRTNSFPALDK